MIIYFYNFNRLFEKPVTYIILDSIQNEERQLGTFFFVIQIK